MIAQIKFNDMIHSKSEENMLANSFKMVINVFASSRIVGEDLLIINLQ